MDKLRYTVIIEVPLNRSYYDGDDSDEQILETENSLPYGNHEVCEVLALSDALVTGATVEIVK